MILFVDYNTHSEVETLYINEIIEDICSYKDVDFAWRRKYAMTQNGGKLPKWFADNERVELFDRDQHKQGYTYIVPRGLSQLVYESLLADGKYKVEYMDEKSEKKRRTIGEKLFRSTITLREDQNKCYQAIVANGVEGIVEAPTGFGKTILGIKVMELMGAESLVLVDKTLIVQEWIEKFKEFVPELFWYKKDNFHFATKQKFKNNRVAFDEGHFIVAVCTPSLMKRVLNPNSRKDRDVKIRAWINTYVDTVVYDEVHHAASDTAVAVLDTLNAYNMIGFSATPMLREDEKDLEYVARIGQIIYSVFQTDFHDEDSIDVQFQYVKNFRFARNTPFKETIYPTSIVYNKERNESIVDIIYDFFEKDRIMLVLIDNLDHARELHTLTDFPYTWATDKEKSEKFRQFKAGEVPVLICTYALAGEGFDYPALDTIIMAGAGKSTIKIIQAVGRALRKLKGKNEPIIIDFADGSLKIRDHTLARLKVYMEQGIFKVKHNKTFIKNYM